MLADEVIAYFHILAIEVNGLNNIAINTFLHSMRLVWPAYFLLGPLITTNCRLPKGRTQK